MVWLVSCANVYGTSPPNNLRPYMYIHTIQYIDAIVFLCRTKKATSDTPKLAVFSPADAPSRDTETHFASAFLTSCFLYLQRQPLIKSLLPGIWTGACFILSKAFVKPNVTCKHICLIKWFLITIPLRVFVPFELYFSLIRLIGSLFLATSWHAKWPCLKKENRNSHCQQLHTAD